MPTEAKAYPAKPHWESDKVREELAEMGRQDLYFLITNILGYDKLTPRAHAHLCKFTQDPPLYNKKPILRRMIQMPRSHFKTTICTIGDSIQEVINDPNIRILLVASSAMNAERFLKEISNHFKQNELFRWLYPEIIPNDFSKIVWNKNEITVVRDAHWREPTIDTIGSKGDVQSRHYNLIKADDIIGEKELNSESEMEKTIEWCSGLESLLVSPIKDRIDYVGTRWRLDDVYAWVEQFYSKADDKKTEVSLGPYAFVKGEIAIFRRPARDENGDPIFPELISREVLDRLMREAPHRYAAQYANDPKAEGLTTFKEEWLRFYKAGGEDGRTVLWTEQDNNGVTLEKFARPQDLERMVFCDPAVGEIKKACRNALLVVGVLKRSKSPLIFLLDYKIGQYRVDQLVDYIFEADKKWNPDFISIEKYGFQGALEHWITERAEKDELPYPPVVLYPRQGMQSSEMAKDQRIKGLQPFFRSGQIYIPEGASEFMEEYTYYPRGRFKDSLDALAQGPSYWPKSENEEAEDAALEYEMKVMASIGPDGYSIIPGSPLDREANGNLDEEPWGEEDTFVWRGVDVRV